MSDIVLTTLNARFSHASMGLRYLRANMGELREHTQIIEFILQSRPIDIVEKLLKNNPKIIGLGVYIWNIDQCTQVVGLLKTIRPDIYIVLGGPEVSYEVEEQKICALADYVITGWGDISFPKLAQDLLAHKIPLSKVIKGEQPPLDSIIMPYAEYTDDDIKNRTIYVEASRGCPFKCEFCLSALDKTAWPFDADIFLQEMNVLYQRGVRLFKFVDRTFNLKPEFSRRILDFFLEKLEQHPHDPIFAHFELIPDHLPDLLKEAIRLFPEGSLQFELGLQTLNPDTQKNISRRTQLDKAENNIRWLITESHAHLHVDLIVGLPGEDLNSFAEGFNRLWSWGPHEIQLGILKRLRGTPIIRHTDTFLMRYNPDAPYQILSNSVIPFEEMQGFSRFARYWDLIANSGRFKDSLSFIMSCRESAYESFFALTEAIYKNLGQTHQIALDRLFLFLHQWLQEQTHLGEVWISDALNALLADYARAGLKGPLIKPEQTTIKKGSGAGRQQRHVH